MVQVKTDFKESVFNKFMMFHLSDYFVIQYAGTAKETGLVATTQSEYYAKLIKDLLNEWKNEKGYDGYFYSVENSLSKMLKHREKFENNKEWGRHEKCEIS